MTAPERGSGRIDGVWKLLEAPSHCNMARRRAAARVLLLLHLLLRTAAWEREEAPPHCGLTTLASSCGGTGPEPRPDTYRWKTPLHCHHIMAGIHPNTMICGGHSSPQNKRLLLSVSLPLIPDRTGNPLIPYGSAAVSAGMVEPKRDVNGVL